MTELEELFMKHKKVKCEYCGKEVVKYLSELKKTKHSFCSKECFAEFKKKQESMLPPSEITIDKNCAKIIINSKKYGKKEALIDLDDVKKCNNKRFYLAKCGNTFYVIFKMGNKQERLHQYLLNGNGEIIDHINGNGLDNRKSNLRKTTRSINMFNRHISKSNTGILGISFVKAYNKYQVHLGKNGKTYYKPATNNLETAIKYKKELEMELYGELRQC